VETLLSLLDGQERSALIAGTRVRRFGRNEVVFHEGDPGDSLHIVEKGLFVARSNSTLGHVLTVNAFRPGAVFGELALLGGDGQRTATVMSLRPGSTRMLHRDDFERLRASNPSVDRFLVGVLAARNRALSAQLMELMFTPTHKRVLRELLRLDDLGIATDDDGWIQLGQDELAMFTGTTRATVNRILRQAETGGLIELGRGRSRLLRRDQLARQAR
jgi:CRP/FNR family cyclic AMP-dependent transcriptional regulator